MAIRNPESSIHTRRAGSVKSAGCWNAASPETFNGISPTKIHSLVLRITRSVPRNYIDAIIESNERLANGKSKELTIYRQQIDVLLTEIVEKARHNPDINKEGIMEKIPKQDLMWDIFLEVLERATPFINKRGVWLSILNPKSHTPTVLQRIRNKALSHGLMDAREPMISLATVLQEVATRKQVEQTLSL